MSAYFDEVAACFAEAIGEPDDSPWGLHMKKKQRPTPSSPNEVVAQMIAEIEPLIIDEEFPEDLRQAWRELPRLRIPYVGILSTMREQIERAHEIFHSLCKRRIKTRFGYFTDHPLNDIAAISRYECKLARRGNKCKS